MIRRQLFCSVAIVERIRPPPHLSFPTWTSTNRRRFRSNHRAGFDDVSLPRQAIGRLEDYPTWGALDRNGGGGVCRLGSFCRNMPRYRRVGAESSSNNLCTTLYTLFLYGVHHLCRFAAQKVIPNTAISTFLLLYIYKYMRLRIQVRK